MSGVVALWGRPRVDADGRELLRWLVAATITGRPVTIVDLAGAGLLDEDLPCDGHDDEAEALRDALVAAGARVVRLDVVRREEAADLGTLLKDAGTLHRLAPRDRLGAPQLLCVDPRGPVDVGALLEAAQVVLVRAGPK